MKKPTVSVIVVNWNGQHHLFTCLSALVNQTYSPTEIIMVDNGSKDNSIQFVKENFPFIEIISVNENRGFSGGNNVGISRARGDFIALINNDTEADKKWLEESINAIKDYPDAGFIASRICLFDHRSYLDTAGDLYFRSGYAGKRGWLKEYGNQYSEIDWVFGACAGAAVYRREMFEEIGLFDDDYVNYFEDVDLSFRAQLSGYTCLYVPTAIVYHKVSSSVGYRSSKHQYWSHRNHWFTLIKNLPSKLWIRYIFPILFSEILVLGSSLAQGRLGVFILARLDVFAKLPLMLIKRWNIQKKRKVTCGYLDSIIQKDWYSYRCNEKKTEREFFDLLKR